MTGEVSKQRGILQMMLIFSTHWIICWSRQFAKGLKCEIITFLSSLNTDNPMGSTRTTSWQHKRNNTHSLSVISEWLACWLEPAHRGVQRSSVRLKGGTFLIPKNTSVNLHYLSYSFLPAVWVNDTRWELVHLVNHHAQCLNKPSEVFFFPAVISPAQRIRCECAFEESLMNYTWWTLFLCSRNTAWSEESIQGHTFRKYYNTLTWPWWQNNSMLTHCVVQDPGKESQMLSVLLP